MRLLEINSNNKTVLENLQQLDKIILSEEAVSSSWIADLTYNEETGSVIMTTLGGGEYEIPNVPYEEYEEWINAPSKGKHWWSAIKGIFT